MEHNQWNWRPTSEIDNNKSSTNQTKSEIEDQISEIAGEDERWWWEESAENLPEKTNDDDGDGDEKTSRMIEV